MTSQLGALLLRVMTIALDAKAGQYRALVRGVGLQLQQRATHQTISEFQVAQQLREEDPLAVSVGDVLASA